MARWKAGVAGVRPPAARGLAPRAGPVRPRPDPARRSTTPTTCRSGTTFITRSSITAMTRSSSSTCSTTRRAAAGPGLDRPADVVRVSRREPAVRGQEVRARPERHGRSPTSMPRSDRPLAGRAARTSCERFSDEYRRDAASPARRRAGARGRCVAVRRASLAAAARRRTSSSGCAASMHDLRSEDGLDHDAADPGAAGPHPGRARRSCTEPEPAAEPDGQAIVPLSDWELASRLSYFLWSSLPDEELLRGRRGRRVARAARACAAGAADAARSRRPRRLATEFFGQWLGFYRFDELPRHRRRAVPRVHGPAQGGDVRRGRLVLRAHRPRGPARRARSCSPITRS